ncbi:PDZ domain-containing protein [Gaoshiqia sediminis]|uniref:PDZ domain-containing protein n=1 Tax=Gaoshiqia sediminis TaxID=2986998 RepID=A0AA41Y426_9BACT|nr:PDZ domain-containing protein [Gaoshiqia sediminis]MCW0483059.1 PDZ domain-containing protein [Gaoshiqia sediminis]
MGCSFEANSNRVFGISAQPLSESERERLGMTAYAGFRVTSVVEGSVAAQMQLAVGDIIVGINGTPFQDMDEFRKLISSDIASVKAVRNGQEVTLYPAMTF